MENNETTAQPVKDQAEKYDTLKALFKAKDAQKISVGVTHAFGSSEDYSYIVGTEGKGKGAKSVLLWQGETVHLLAFLLKQTGFRVKDAGVNIDDMK